MIPIRLSSAARATLQQAAPATGARGADSRDRTFLQVLTEARRPSGGATLGSTAAGIAGPPRARLGPVARMTAAAGGATPARAPPAGPFGLRLMAERALGAERRVDDLLAAAARGKTFTAAELIAWQALVFRYSQTVEVISRAADRLMGSIKQTIGTQV